MVKHCIFALLTIPVAATQASCMTHSPSDLCTVHGAAYLPGNLSEADICARFRAQLAKGLEKGTADALPLTLRIGKDGTLEAEIASDPSNDAYIYPKAAVDVMDRAIQMSDLDQLAANSARIVASRKAN